MHRLQLYKGHVLVAAGRGESAWLGGGISSDQFGDVAERMDAVHASEYSPPASRHRSSLDN